MTGMRWGEGASYCGERPANEIPAGPRSEPRTKEDIFSVFYYLAD